MRTWQMAAAAALIAAAGVVVVAPAPAMAAGVVACELGGVHTTSPKTDYVYCTLTDSAPSGEVWLGIQVLSGQGTANLTASCAVGTLTYYPHVNYTNNGVATSASFTEGINCGGGGKV